MLARGRPLSLSHCCRILLDTFKELYSIMNVPRHWRCNMLDDLVQQLIEREWKHQLDVMDFVRDWGMISRSALESKQMLARIESMTFDPKTLTLREQGRQALSRRTDNEPNNASRATWRTRPPSSSIEPRKYQRGWVNSFTYLPCL